MMEAVESAAWKGNLQAVTSLLEAIHDQKLKDQCCLNAVKSAAEYKHAEVVDFLIAAVSSEELKRSCCIQAMISAAKVADPEPVDRLVSSFSYLNLDKDFCCIEAAAAAARKGHLEVVERLVSSIAELSLKDQCLARAANSAAEKGHFEIIVSLARGIDDQKLRDECYSQASLSAAKKNQYEVVAVLLNCVCDLIVKDDCLTAVVKSAAALGHVTNLSSLVQGISDPKLKDRCCFEAAEISAKKECRAEVFVFLVNCINDHQLRGKCCLKAAKSSRSVEMLRCLMLANIDQELRDQCYMEAAKHTAMDDNLEIVMLCVESIQNPTLRQKCCTAAADKLAGAFMPSLNIALYLVGNISDQTVKDQCCSSVVFQTAGNYLDFVDTFLNSISNQTTKNDCCLKAMEVAAKHGRECVVKYLLQALNGQVDQTAVDLCCMKAVESAGEKGRTEVILLLLEAMHDQDLKDKCCAGAVTLAAKKGHSSVVRILLAAIVSEELRESCRLKAVIAAVASISGPNAIETIGIEADWLFQYSTLLNYLASFAISGDNSLLERVLDRTKSSQITHLLCLSISVGHIALALALVTRVSEVDLPNSSGATALMLAAEAGQHELAIALLDHGASVYIADDEGRTALSRACQAGQVRVAKTLMDRGADANHCDALGRSCAHLAEQHGHSHVIQLLYRSQMLDSANRISDDDRHSADVQELVFPRDETEWDENLSAKLCQLLNVAGFTQWRATCQQTLADILEGVARNVTKENRQMTGSYSDGWANSLVQVNGRTGADSDIDWTVLIAGKTFHLEGGCTSAGYRLECKTAVKVPIREGHAQVLICAGSQPAVAVKACGSRPAQDTCHAFQCCSSYCAAKIQTLLKNYTGETHLVRATRPNETNELRVSFSFEEKRILRQLTSTSGQLFTLLKFLFKRYLPHTLKTPGLKTYHAKTLLFFMLEKNGPQNEEVWQPKNFIKLLKESLDLMLYFLDSNSSLDECMPHFFMSDAPLYFKNAGLGGDFNNTKIRVRNQLYELRRDIGKIFEQLSRHMRPLQSDKFIFHPLTLLPLMEPPKVAKIRRDSFCNMLSDIYSIVHQCMGQLQSDECNQKHVMTQLSSLRELNCCKCTAICLTAMAHLKFGEQARARDALRRLDGKSVRRGWDPVDIIDRKKWGSVDRIWRFCLPGTAVPLFPFDFPAFTQSLITVRQSQPNSAHLYVNFRCLSWSLRAELISPAIVGWLGELQDDPDLEELFTLAHYSDSRAELQFCLATMELIRNERRVAMEKVDFDKIEYVREKLGRLD